MITRMKKLTFLIYHREYEHFLEQLRALGVVHIVERQHGEMDTALTSIMQKRNLYKTTLQRMANLADVDSEKTNVPATIEQGDAIIAQFDDCLLRIQELQQQIPAIDKEIEMMEPWGDFSWDEIQRLEKTGWYVQFFECADKEYQSGWETDYNAVIINDEGAHRRFVTVNSSPIHFDLEALRLPDESLAQLRDKKKCTQESLAAAQNELCTFAQSHYGELKSANVTLQQNIDWQKVKLSSESMADGAVVLLEGWIPEDSEASVAELLQKSDVYYEIRAARRDDNAPIKLKNNAFSRMYEVLTKMYGMPDYAEFDPTPILAPFFSLFFAFCMGDAGYGLVLIALGFLLKKKLGKSMAGMMNLVITLGAFTTIVGAILGTFFGVALVDVDLPENLKQFMIVGKIGETSYDKQMLLALIIGVVHISLAMTVKAIGETVRFGFKESLSAWGWLLLVVGSVVVFTLAFFEVISKEMSVTVFYVIGGISAIGIYVLNNIHRNVLVNVGAGLWDTYNMATGLMGDILSYIRLYALGLAGGMLGGVFNQLAFMVNDAAGPALGWLFCGLILVFGHTLNIAMSCLSAFVHPLRLTFVEYFKNSGYDGKGEEYKPFSVKKE